MANIDLIHQGWQFSTRDTKATATGSNAHVSSRQVSHRAMLAAHWTVNFGQMLWKDGAGPEGKKKKSPKETSWGDSGAKAPRLRRLTNHLIKKWFI